MPFSFNDFLLECNFHRLNSGHQCPAPWQSRGEWVEGGFHKKICFKTAKCTDFIAVAELNRPFSIKFPAGAPAKRQFFLPQILDWPEVCYNRTVPTGKKPLQAVTGGGPGP